MGLFSGFKAKFKTGRTVRRRPGVICTRFIERSEFDPPPTLYYNNQSEAGSQLPKDHNHPVPVTATTSRINSRIVKKAENNDLFSKMGETVAKKVKPIAMVTKEPQMVQPETDDDGGNFTIHIAQHKSDTNSTNSYVSNESPSPSPLIGYSSQAASIFFGGGHGDDDDNHNRPMTVQRPRSNAWTTEQDNTSQGSSASA